MLYCFHCCFFFFFFKQKTAYEMRISDWSSDVCSSDLLGGFLHLLQDEGRDLARAVVLALRLDPGVAVMLDDLVRHQIHVLLGHGIVEAPADQALDGEE